MIWGTGENRIQKLDMNAPKAPTTSVGQTPIAEPRKPAKSTLAVEWVFSGTFKAPFEMPGAPAIPPTGSHVEANMATFYTVNSKGLLSEGRNYLDEASFYKQLGVKI